MKIKCELPVYEINGKETDQFSRHYKNMLSIENHKDDYEKLVITFSDNGVLCSQTIAIKDLEKAIDSIKNK